MFDNLTERLNRTLKNISGKGRITEDNIKDTLREVRTALLEADVALPVVKSFTQKVKEKALGQEVSLSLTPGQEFIKTVYAQLVETMGGETAELNLATQPPAVILLAGLQGAGKTTSAAKLALYIKERLKKKVLMVSVDTYRPAAIDQLLTLAKEINVDAFPSDPKSTPEAIAAAALAEAKARFYDVLIVDTAGRLAVDEFMMDEVKKLHAVVNPIETLFVVDAMTGQDAANTAKAFAEALPLTGVILTKADGDARGGAALSVREITGKPIKFIGMGEKVAALEPFHPDRIASRILDMGDLLSLIEQLQRSTDVEKAKKMAEKIKKGKGFTFDDFLSQLQEMKKMGGLTGLMDKLPGMGNLSDQIKSKVNDKQLLHMEAIICSMTKKERRKPEIIKGSRKRRIAAGAGVQIQEVNQLLKQFEMMQKMMKKMGSGGMRNMMRGMMGGLSRMGMGGMPNFPGMGGMFKR
ncbi:signal recognition particle protein [Succinatimonas hippei]|uniref:Signal recognition particle protein n=1 Tax=Succinatimonas hippei (strain DSM 22608 / JCM 16073 / KCTC 15190 / YIT 12066) TaxID=762983 RepID=E8LLL9_SUCHY|nr:signal recognition particle protein [Succinatimonas hippei]EFY06592.1 signal recognition particle protein [Succinatimonas hippei YIT 12066]